MSEAWKWHENENVIIPEVRAIAVYTNPACDIVIRQEGSGYGDNPDDAVVVIPRKMVAALVKALRAEVAKDCSPDLPG